VREFAAGLPIEPLVPAAVAEVIRIELYL